ncbi:phosphorylase, partial [Streptococcus suis]
MLLEEFENNSAVIETTDMDIRGGGEVCETMILSFNGEIVELVRQI